MKNKGQFSIIAALLVATILIASVAVTYSIIRNSPIRDQPPIQNAIDETNFAIKQIAGFAVGYYGSMLQVTGNSTYANMSAINYFQSGLVNIANMHPERATSLELDKSQLGTYWFSNVSYSSGSFSVNYNLTGLGISGAKYTISCKLSASILNRTGTQAVLNVTQDDSEPLVNLGKQNFRFYSYDMTDSSWDLISPANDPRPHGNGTYEIDIPSGVDPYSYVVQIEDLRGIIVVASSFDSYSCALTWANVSARAPAIVELLQNGTMRWLGQNLSLTSQAKPIPPIMVKSLHVNQTLNGVASEAPFQIEDWASDYRIPLGITNNASIFNRETMLVFMVNPNVSSVTLWWNGSDTATQTSLAYTNKYFNDNPSSNTLRNSAMTLRFDTSSSNFKAISTVGTSSCTATFMRISARQSTYGAGPAYVITNGTIRDIVHQEAEWSNGVPNCPDIYSDIVLTLPANTTYYTYQLRLMFVESKLPRNITELCPISISGLSGQMQTENGTAGGYPIVSNNTGVFYNYSSLTWAHHWSQAVSAGKGAGIMLTDSALQALYLFDTIAGNKTSGIKASSMSGPIELLPITRYQVNINPPLDSRATDIIWYGAVATFDGTTPIYDNYNQTGLWTLVEYPPSITVTT